MKKKILISMLIVIVVACVGCITLSLNDEPKHKKVDKTAEEVKAKDEEKLRKDKNKVDNTLNIAPLEKPSARNTTENVQDVQKKHKDNPNETPISTIISPNNKEKGVELVVEQVTISDGQSNGVIKETKSKEDKYTTTLTNDLSVSIQEIIQLDKPQSYAYVITNSGDKDVILSFGSGRKFDYIIYNEAGNKIFQLSDDKFYTQALVDVKIKSGQSVLRDISVEQLPTGDYTVKAWLPTSDGNILETTKQIHVL